MPFTRNDLAARANDYTSTNLLVDPGLNGIKWCPPSSSTRPRSVPARLVDSPNAPPPLLSRPAAPRAKRPLPQVTAVEAVKKHNTRELARLVQVSKSPVAQGCAKPCLLR